LNTGGLAAVFFGERGGMAMNPPLTAPRLVAKLAVAILLLALVLLVPAGTWRWPAAWAYIGLYLAFAIPVGAWLLRTNPDLLAEVPGYADYAARVRSRLLPGIF
jgi:hypothetical protein